MRILPDPGWVIALVTVVTLVSVYLFWTARRVDRLHSRAAWATKSLDAHLLRRAAAAAVLAEELDASEAYAAARYALDAPPGEREAAENDLTRQLRLLFARGAPDPSTTTVIAASRRVALARQVHTDLVRDALLARGRPIVRLLGMAREHERPGYFDIDDPTLQVVSEANRPRPTEELPGLADRRPTGSPVA